MKAKVIRIGNSRGIRIPGKLIEEAGLTGEVDLAVDHGCLVVRPLRRSRSGWDEAFAAMSKAADDRLVDEGRLPRSRWDDSEWRW